MCDLLAEELRSLTKLCGTQGRQRRMTVILVRQCLGRIVHFGVCVCVCVCVCVGVDGFICLGRHTLMYSRGDHDILGETVNLKFELKDLWPTKTTTIPSQARVFPSPLSALPMFLIQSRLVPQPFHLCLLFSCLFTGPPRRDHCLFPSPSWPTADTAPCS